MIQIWVNKHYNSSHTDDEDIWEIDDVIERVGFLHLTASKIKKALQKYDWIDATRLQIPSQFHGFNTINDWMLTEYIQAYPEALSPLGSGTECEWNLGYMQYQTGGFSIS